MIQRHEGRYAVALSWNHSLKVEAIHGERFATREIRKHEAVDHQPSTQAAHTEAGLQASFLAELDSARLAESLSALLAGDGLSITLCHRGE